MLALSSLPPLSLYIHLPWCVRKCPYCDFNSHEARGGVPETQYVDALLRDLEQDLPRVWGRRVQTIFFGGGTPSLFSPEAIDRLLAGVRARVPLDPLAEITLEANPGTTDLARFRGYREAGINRLSIGIQSFDDTMLAALGRIHGRAEALRAAEAARDAGFDNFNLDLMFGLPQQTIEAARRDLRQAIALAPTHLSLYQLTIEPNTVFHHRPPTLPDDDSLWAMQQDLQALLAAGGYEQYEVSAYALPGQRCLHNLNYWRFGDYLGIGAGAHAKISDANGITRLSKRKQPRDYLDKAGTPQAIAEEQRLQRQDLPLEFMMNALRLTEGFAPSLVLERTGLPIGALQRELALAERKQLIAWDHQLIRPTELGRRFLNDLLVLFTETPVNQPA